ncbi:MAG TPA: hypothetical protein VFI74_05430 [Candidatus Saccharimonadales bacterium]|nr:hypothetical protein [Candidatus Saccharimonadales bacterium]
MSESSSLEVLLRHKMALRKGEIARIEGSAQVIEELKTAADPITLLNETEQTYRYYVAQELGDNAQNTLAVYGERALAWTHLNYSDKDSPSYKAAIDQTSYGASRLQCATSWAWIRNRGNLPFAEAQYNLMAGFEAAVQAVPIQEIVANTLQPGVRCSPQKLGAYSLRSLEIDRSDGFVWGAPHPFANDIYLDAPLGFALYYRDVPQIVGGVSLSYPTELMLYQMQRLSVDHSQSGRGWPRLNWQATLVQTAEHIAIQNGLAFTGIQHSKRNRWARRHKKHFTPKIARKLYDDTARSQGYWLGKDGDWHLQMPTPDC